MSVKKNNVYYMDDYRRSKTDLFDPDVLDEMSFEDLCVLKGYLQAMANMNDLELVFEEDED